MTRGELTERLFAAGVADLRGRALAPDIVFDGLDPEPPLSTNLRLLMERSEELLAGMRIVMQIHGAARARLAVPADRRALYRSLRSMLASSVNLHAAAVPNRYPARHPALLPALAGLPAGSPIYSMEDALRIKQAVCDGRPLTASCATLWDERSGLRRNAELPAGTTAGEALGLKRGAADNGCLVLGGLLSGTSVHSVLAPAGRAARGVMLLNAGRAPARSACDNCGRCLAVCPARLAPSQIYRLERDGVAGAMARLGPGACLDCGLCSDACPAGFDLCQQVRIARRLAAGAG
jgi:electron transport complex protein RnfC